MSSSSFFKAVPLSPPLTRAQKIYRFQKANELIEDIEHNTRKLKKDSNSIAKEKYEIMSKITTHFDQIIQKFNEFKADPTDKEIMDFSRNLFKVIQGISKENFKVIATPRDKKKENLSNAVYYSAYGATVVASTVVTGGAILPLITFFYAGPKIGTSMQNAVGLNNYTTTSASLLSTLQIELIKINVEMSSKVFPKQSVEEEMEFICPITLQVFTDPVICTLDNIIYERVAIRTWLALHSKSVCGSEFLQEHQKPDDALKECPLSYLNMLKKYRREHPSIDDLTPKKVQI